MCVCIAWQADLLEQVHQEAVNLQATALRQETEEPKGLQETMTLLLSPVGCL